MKEAESVLGLLGGASLQLLMCRVDNTGVDSTLTENKPVHSFQWTGKFFEAWLLIFLESHSLNLDCWGKDWLEYKA